MNIHFLTPKFSKNEISNNVRNLKSNSVNYNSYPNLRPLNQDTVSFQGNVAKKATSTVSEHLEAQIAAESPRLRRIATIYLDVLESVAGKLKDRGFSFDREYCELNPVKSPQSYTSKVVRSGSLKVPDTIRATLYCDDPYDLSKLIEGLLPEMEQRGYILAKTETSLKDLMKRGYIPTTKELANPEMEKTIPDLDIRLEDVSEQIGILPKNLKYSIGKPQKSGYEDIQMRFVREFDKKNNPVQHELIILFGPNTSIAKHEESEKVYNHLRKFNEFNISFENTEVGSNDFKTMRYIEMIEQMFRGKVSKKLFANAKNKDYSKIDYEIPISFTEEDKLLFENCFASIRNGIQASYRDAIARAEASEIAQAELRQNRKKDLELLSNIQNNLRKTIEHYNYKNDLKASKQQ